ncbi:hypothetical protein DJ568_14365 [Mucilaginibacter hurinus]|uniref:SCP domain-containing protein n=1 Tax=Mucilaginibacter hurinus TaxID=2201324 RepID=A0A367GM01_9SPHI|nr:CvpA family protein [Mucilaginibacter hurinus]RCH54065.1 hypothetical protein DJ568_14365 [Mucilaginibacter hurinus]
MINWVDVILILILLLCAVTSVRRGFILSTLDLLSWAGSLMASILLNKPLSNLLDKNFTAMGPWSAPVAFIIVLVAARITLDTLADRVLNKIPEKTHRTTVNRLLGIAPGIINGFLWIAIAASLFRILPIMSPVAESGRSSKVSNWVIGDTSWFQEKASPVFTALFNRIVPKTDAAVGKEKFITLPFKVNNPQRRTDLEASMLTMVNRERRKHGLTPLKADPAIAVAALKHSKDMFARGYFSHLTPEGKNPFERIRDEKVMFIAAGENLAIAPTLAKAHEGLMNSPGHRANILHAAFGRLGIGILDGGIYGLMITQNFRN